LGPWERGRFDSVIPYRSFRLGILSAKGRPMDATATVTVEQAADPGATWIEEAIAFFSLPFLSPNRR
jgi:hypothetical protein